MKKILLYLLILTQYSILFSQNDLKTPIKSIDYSNPKEYEIGGVTISGIENLDANVLLYVANLEVGKKIIIPSDAISKAIKKLWEQGLFSDVEINITKIINDKVFLDIYLQERPRLARYSIQGAKKSEVDDIRDKIKLIKGAQITDNTLLISERVIKEYFIDKGFFNVKVDITQAPDSIFPNSVSLKFLINKGKRIKINEIVFSGNNLIGKEKKWYNKYRDDATLADVLLRRSMKETKQKTWYNVFKASKYIPEKFEEDKKNILSRYNELGYRDAKIIYDSISTNDDKTINLYIGIDEGRKFYFRNISWLGNTKYNSEFLTQVLGIKKGDVYNAKFFEEKLFHDPLGVMSLYQDNGYLFSNINPVEILIENDSIDMELRVYEGKQAKINRVEIAGNTRTNDHVIMRELRTRPGALYKRSEVQRTIRELAQLGYFDPEKLNVDFQPNPSDGTVDLEYVVEEKPSDQVELSAGWGGGFLVGTLGLTFNNFSLKNIFNFKSYRPLPSGDGQKISLRVQASGLWGQYYSFSFAEPWFGGKKPNSLTTSVYHSTQSNAYSVKDADSTQSYHFKMTGAALGLGHRLQVPDDFFTLYTELGYRHYNIRNYSLFPVYKTGRSHNLSLKSVLGRHSSGPNPIFPTAGSSLSFSIELTPPYSLFNGKVYSDDMLMTERYKWIEYHKYKFTGQWFNTLLGSKDGSSRALVLMTKLEFGLLGMYNKKVGASPFENFQLGGDGLTGYNGYYGSENIGLRGYENNSLTPKGGGNIYDKFSIELRYPLSLSPTMTLYALCFVEAGNAWSAIENFNPFDVKRSAGVGVRIFMPMIGLLGVDWGYGFDEIPGNPKASKGQFHLVIGQQF